MTCRLCFDRRHYLCAGCNCSVCAQKPKKNRKLSNTRTSSPKRQTRQTRQTRVRTVTPPQEKRSPSWVPLYKRHARLIEIMVETGGTQREIARTLGIQRGVVQEAMNWNAQQRAGESSNSRVPGVFAARTL